MAETVDLLRYFAPRHEHLLDVARALVERESPTRDAEAAAVMIGEIRGRLDRAGASTRLLETSSGPHLLARREGDRSCDARPVMLLGHVDTVWPRGTLGRRPFQVEEGRAYGPGIFDMKSGVAVMVAALEAIGELALPLPHPLKILLTCDEESGSSTSRDLIEAEARECAAVLVLEPPLPGGRAKTGRKGVARYELIARGVAAHAGLAPEQGVSAIAELAHQVLAVVRWNGLDGINVNIGVIHGGTVANVVAAEARAEIDVRFSTLAQAERMADHLSSLAPVLSGARLELHGGVDRPPLERTAAVAALYGQARSIAAALGFELGEGSAGGGSDGNFTAALGIPTLDGLGVDGDGAHAEHEHILIGDLPRRAALLTALLTRPLGLAAG